ncbi:RagB/SusD family nutrient uptake outer membrane protein [Parabacteroides sp. OttesenSCG-928-G06]|nr:RagB/SusD family nutrient uptake outer membrane protein [Parabacteroides sp. OttesenSCG-928-G06]
MKSLVYKSLIVSIALAFLSGCQSLDLSPEGQLTTANPLSTVAELQKYMNQFYEGTFTGHPGGMDSDGIAYLDKYSDNQVVPVPPPLINGTRSISSAGTITEYQKIRAVNFLFENIDNCMGTQTDIDHYTGEAHFFRAYYYFSMLKKYGGVSWVDKVLPPDAEAMKIGRETHAETADRILKDLDMAISLLYTRNNSATMRIHKDVALAFKSRVALYEGTWQKYHKQKNTPFFTQGIGDDKINNYLTQARDAAKEVINSGRWSIHTNGKPLEDYQRMFITYDLSNNKEILFWKKYDMLATPVVAHSITRYLNDGGGNNGFALSLIDDYLTRDGRIFTGEERDNAQKIYGRELEPELRDPRLCQTVARPGVRMKPTTASNIYMPPFCPLISSVTPSISWTNPSGYSILKFVEIDCPMEAVTGDSKSQAPAIQFRYAEVLLNYAEALAELQGAAAQAEIKNVLQPLRDRVDMPAIDFAREYNTSADYSFRNLEATLQVVRRERRIELAAEGMRMDDLFRWAMGDEILTGKRPLGPLFIGSNMVEANVEGAYYGGKLIYDQASGNNIYLSGKPGDSKRYIDPYRNLCPDGLGFNPNRDYLYPISQDQIALTGEMWKQNPGW